MFMLFLQRSISAPLRSEATVRATKARRGWPPNSRPLILSFRNAPRSQPTLRVRDVALRFFVPRSFIIPHSVYFVLRTAFLIIA